MLVTLLRSPAVKMIEFGKKELGSLGMRPFYHASRMFWQKMRAALR